MAKEIKKIPVSAVQIELNYIDYILTHNEPPNSIYDFAKKLKISEGEFYNFFASFKAIEKSVWNRLINETIVKVSTQEVWNQYSAREKMLSFFYSYTELLQSQRSFVVYSLKKQKRPFVTPAVLSEVKITFEDFAQIIIDEGIEERELADRKFISKRYKDALWLQFLFIIDFWINDDSLGFEKTDEAIEKGINVTFDFFQHSPLDNLFEYGKFLTRNRNFREKMGI